MPGRCENTFAAQLAYRPRVKGCQGRASWAWNFYQIAFAWGEKMVQLVG